MSLIDRILRPAGPASWSAADVSARGLLGVTVGPAANPGGKPRVLRCATLPNAQLGTESLSALSKLLQAHNTPWVLPLPRKDYNILVIAEPAVRADEMHQSVRWAISNMVDYPTDDAFISWMKIPTETLMPGRPPHIYVVVARNHIVAENQAAFQRSKLQLAAVDVRETAHRNISALVEKPGEGLVMLAIGATGVQLTITFRGDLYLDRYIEENLFNDNGDESTRQRASERIVLQVQRSLDFVSRTLSFIDISRVVLAPLPAETPLRSALELNLPVPLEVLDLASLFDFSATPELADTTLQADYLVALGAALRFRNNAS